MTMRFAEFDEGGEGRPVLGVTRSATGRRWRQRLNAAGEAVALAMSQRHAIDPTVARIMAGRGVGLDAAEGFLEPTIRALMPDPSTLVDMDRAAARLADAV